MLGNWVTKNNITFPVGMITGDADKVKSNWAVNSMPWLILTDKKHIVQAEGFGISELDEKITTFNEKEGAFECKLNTLITDTCSVLYRTGQIMLSD